MYYIAEFFDMKIVTNVPVDQNMQEDIHYLTTKKPIEFYRAILRPEDTERIPWHWHPALQIALVLAGQLTYYVDNEVLKLKKGDGILINVNRIHRYGPTGSEPVRLIHVMLLPEFLAGTGSNAFTKYVEPFLLDEGRHCLVFRQAVDWQQEILELFYQAFQVEAAEIKEPGYEMEVHELMSAMWRRIIKNMEAFPALSVSRSKLVSQVRIKQMLTYIDENYSEKITLDDIAGAACISKREALRCFKENMRKTPFAYLMEFRIGQAKNELVQGNRPIMDVALSCGFESASYFNRVFRRYTGMTPMQYRKHEATR